MLLPSLLYPPKAHPISFAQVQSDTRGHHYIKLIKLICHMHMCVHIHAVRGAADKLIQATSVSLNEWSMSGLPTLPFTP